MAAATATANQALTSVLTDAEESINNGVKEVERTFLFTDVPCGAMKLRAEDFSGSNPAETTEDVAAELLTLCGAIQRSFCFTDLEDIDETEVERLKSKSAAENEIALKEEVPAVEAADTESMSDGSAPKEVDDADPTATPVKEAEPVAEATKNVTSVDPPATTITTEDKVEEVKVVQSETSLPPANALQASGNATKDGKPMNALQAAKAAKAAEKAAKAAAKAAEKAAKAAAKKDGGKKGWGFFRKSSKKA